MGNFPEWLQVELDNREWTQADLARKAELSRTVISRVMNGERLPGVDFCKGVARAFNLRDIEVMRYAGIADPEPATDIPSIRELVGTFNELDDENRETILKMLRALNEMQQAEKRRGLKLKPKTG